MIDTAKLRARKNQEFDGESSFTNEEVDAFTDEIDRLRAENQKLKLKVQRHRDGMLIDSEKLRIALAALKEISNYTEDGIPGVVSAEAIKEIEGK